MRGVDGGDGGEGWRLGSEFRAQLTKHILHTVNKFVVSCRCDMKEDESSFCIYPFVV